MRYMNWKVMLSIVVMFLPRRVKAFALNLIPGNDISPSSHLGFSLILSKRIIMKGGSRIGHFNFVKDLELLMLEENAVLYNCNRIRAFSEFRLGKRSKVGSHNFIAGDLIYTKGGSKFVVGEFSTVTAHHLFDLIGNIMIGSNTVIAGTNSQFYTHAFDLERNRVERDIHIGDNSYIGSRCVVLADVAANVIVGAGTTVYRDILEAGLWSSHRLERVGPIVPVKERPDVSTYRKAGYTFWIRE